MPDKFQNKYRIPSTRLQNWDYSSNAAYFITICTKNRKHFFGEIINKEIQLNDIGKLAEQFLLEIPNHFSFIELGNFVVMPNHMHGILIIDKPDNGNNKNVVDNKSPGQQRFQNHGKDTISSIVGSYKSVVSKNAHFTNPAFAWQSRFYDHIIRNGESFERIQNYIANNPSNWKDDTFYS